MASSSLERKSNRNHDLTIMACRFAFPVDHYRLANFEEDQLSG
jgi:hypothetical protein